MESNELRVNNWYNYKGHEVKLTIEDFCEGKYNLLELLKPIEITEEWLLKFGFKKIGDSLKIPLTDFLELTYLSFFDSEQVLVSTKKSGFMERVGCVYVHQLQNIYFSLTKKELTIKEP